jgi:Raf kinase inhibitor-like YbhB/YbcL family protein
VGPRGTLLSCVFAVAALAGCGGDDKEEPPPPAAPDTIAFSTPAFKDGGAIPKEETCDGAGTPPTMAWRDLPPGAVELVLVVEDPDAPSGTFTHWTAWGIAASTGAGLAPHGQFPAGVKEGENSAGKTGWTPPCPPEGDDPHRYVFSLYALDKGVTLTPGASPDEVRGVLKGALARGTFTGTYKR